MTALPAPSAPRPGRRPPTRTTPPLRPVPEVGSRTRPRLVYAVIAVGAVAAIVVVQLLLSIALAQGAYEIDRFQLRQTELAREEQKLSEELDRLGSPQYLAMNAEALGMVPNTAPVYLRLSDGAVLGEPTAASGGAAASAPLVPNALIAGVPPVTSQPPQQAQAPVPAGGAAGGAAETPPAAAAPGEPQPAAPPAPTGLPTPATH